MNAYHLPILALLLAFSPAGAESTELQPVASADARWPLTELLRIDTRYPQDAARSAIEPDDFGERYRVAFLADDGSRVNGVLAMPGDGHRPARLAIALHPMGSDQSIWWRAGKPLFGGEITQRLRQRGYAVLALDARWHGERRVDGLGPRDLLAFAHGDNPRPYHQVIADSVRDYRLALRWAEQRPELDTRGVFVVGYSMGAQMSLLLAATEPRVASVLAMVPPYVDRRHSPVAPRNHVGAITGASVLLIAARQDPHSSRAQTEQVFAAVASPAKELRWHDSGHLLPESYVTAALSYVDASSGVERR